MWHNTEEPSYGDTNEALTPEPVGEMDSGALMLDLIYR
jgi:hypothetical protein